MKATPMNLNRQIEKWLQSSISSTELTKRPFVTLAYAQSWDGSITTRCGEKLNFSCKESTELTHQLRSLHDGILVGIGTVLSDDPQLTVRDWDGPNPQPIVLDSHLRIPNSAKVCHHPDKCCWILTRKTEFGPLTGNAEIVTVNGEDNEQGNVPLVSAMEILYERGIRSLMVEGGAKIITAFLQAHLVDALVLTVAPQIVGGYKAVGDLQSVTGHEIPDITPIFSSQAGEDFIIWGRLYFKGKSN